MTGHKIRKHLTSFQVIFFGFGLLDLCGALLLMLPVSSRLRQWTPFSDAIFTSTSAVCVTGLVVRDTGTYWSLFGQIIILILIQIGGLGVVMAASAIAILSGRKISLMQRSVLQNSISAPHIGGIVRLTRFITTTLFSIEGIGAAVLATRFIPKFGWAKGLWYSLFHSISATCNAGFDLMGNFASLTQWDSDPVVTITIMLLILTGGIGFMTWYDFSQHHFHFSRYSLQSKLVLAMTPFLIVLPTLYFYFVEFSAYRGSTRLLVSLFQAVTPRTAGFNTVNLNLLSDTGIMIMIFLMLTGGAPGSTAGGMKITTIAVLFLSARSAIRNHDKATVFNRSLHTDTILNAAHIALLYLGLFLIGAGIISTHEGLPLRQCLFETASAVCTVGLTLGITTTVSTLSRVILIALMFIGRIGTMTMIYAIFNDPHTKHTHNVPEKVIVG